MDFNKRFVISLLGLSTATATTVTLPQFSLAQGGLLLQRLEQRRAAEQNPSQPNQTTPQPPVAANPEVSMVTLQVQPGAGGQQMVITPKGIPVPLPGPGVLGPVVHVYMGNSGGYWYTDKNNQTVDLTPAVNLMRANASAIQAPIATIPQYAPPPQVYINNQTTTPQGSSAATTAAAAGLGAMAGAAMTSSSGWNTVPYGTPIHYGAGAVPYYNQGGKPVYINAANTELNQANVYHAAAMEQQQNWYKQQQVAQGANWKAWQGQTANPFVNSSYAHYGAAAGATAAEYGAAQGQQAAKYGAAAGATAAHYGAEQGQQAERYGAAAGATAAHYGAEQGQQAEKYGAAAGAGAAHYGAEQGQQEKREGAAAGAGAAHYGQSEGENAAKFGAAAGKGGGRFGGAEGGKAAGRFGGEEGRAGGRGRFGGEGEGREGEGREGGGRRF